MTPFVVHWYRLRRRSPYVLAWRGWITWARALELHEQWFPFEGESAALYIPPEGLYGPTLRAAEARRRLQTDDAGNPMPGGRCLVCGAVGCKKAHWNIWEGTGAK